VKGFFLLKTAFLLEANGLRSGQPSEPGRLRQSKARRFIGYSSFRLVILLHDAVRINVVFAVDRCPSVTLVHIIQMAKDIVKLLSRPGSPISLAFLTPSADTQLRGLQRGR